MAQGAREQASSLEEISSSLEEMASMMSRNADNATQADGLAKEAQTGAEKYSAAMNNMQDAIDRLFMSSEQQNKPRREVFPLNDITKSYKNSVVPSILVGK